MALAELQPVPARTLLGREIRTSNAHPEEIGAHWHAFFANGAGADIPGRISEDLFAVYSDYEGDEDMPYSFFIGVEVAAGQAVPDGMCLREIPHSNFACFTAEGDQPAAMIQKWGEIHAAALPRSFQLDFEVHRANPPGRVDIWIGLNSDSLA